MRNSTPAVVIHPEYQLYQKNNIIYCTSLQVAESFGKRHDHVLEDIAKLGLPKSGETEENNDSAHVTRVETIREFFKQNFIRTTYTNSQNKKQPMYLMTEEGFTVLTMGYNGEKALCLKIQYVKNFKAMQAFIKDYILAKKKIPLYYRLSYCQLRRTANVLKNERRFLYAMRLYHIYRIVLGMDAKTFRKAHGIEHGKSIRPYLTENQYRAIRDLQKQDIRMLYRGIGYLERKNILSENALQAIPLKEAYHE